MSLYPSAQALIDDARLRLDQFGHDKAVLVVEGPDDKRLMSRMTVHRQQVLASGGRRLLLRAHEECLASGDTNIAFLTDCDYEVGLGSLQPGPKSLFITENADVEADLVVLGGLQNIVAELVPGSDSSDESLGEVTSTVLERSVAIAEPLGRARRVAKSGAFPIRTDLRLQRYRTTGTANVDEEKMADVIANTSPDCPLSERDLTSLMSEGPSGYSMCNGHDLTRAVERVLRDDFGVNTQTAESIERLLRVGMAQEQLDRWAVVVRLRRWETESDVQLLA